MALCGRYLHQVLRAAGVELVAGQILLLDPALARSMIEETLAELDFQETPPARARERVADALGVAAEADGASTLPREEDSE